MKHARLDVSMGWRHAMTLLLVVCAACGDDDNDDSGPSDNLSDTELAQQWKSKLDSCEVYAAPENEGLSDYESVKDDFSRCAARCDLAASCEQILEAWCEGGLPAGHPLLKCFQKCSEEPKDGFACDNGDRIPFVSVCDGIETCSNGEDEKDCKPYVCEDGQELIGKDIHCDNRGQCEDYSDELDCPLTCELRQL